MNVQNPKAFQADYTQAVDDKHRVAIPAALREGRRATEISVTKTPGAPSLRIYAPSAFQDDRETFRLVSAFSRAASVDASGRFVLSDDMRKHLNLKGKKVVFVGCGDRIEIWSPANWKREEQSRSAELAAALERRDAALD